jgi:hypothetical protein
MPKDHPFAHFFRPQFVSYSIVLSNFSVSGNFVSLNLWVFSHVSDNFCFHFSFCLVSDNFVSVSLFLVIVAAHGLIAVCKSRYFNIRK